jgi:hypothetical protein
MNTLLNTFAQVYFKILKGRNGRDSAALDHVHGTIMNRLFTDSLPTLYRAKSIPLRFTASAVRSDAKN